MKTIIAAAYAAALLVLSLVPVPPPSLSAGPDKLKHIAAYLVLFLVVDWASGPAKKPSGAGARDGTAGAGRGHPGAGGTVPGLPGEVPALPVRRSSPVFSRRRMAIAVLCFFYGVMIEFIQPFTGRTFQVLDMAANGGGIAAGYVIRALPAWFSRGAGRRH